VWLWTGLRLGELLALRWQDVDFLKNKIRVSHSLWNGELVSPKTEDSAASVPMKSALREALLRQRAQTSGQADGFVFCKADGTPHHPDVLRKDVLYPALDRLGIARRPRQTGFHCFRHSAGSVVQEKTKNMKAAQSLLRHASYSTTADIYVHVSDEVQEEAAEALEQAIFPESVTSCYTNAEHVTKDDGESGELT
jgi:integrase